MIKGRHAERSFDAEVVSGKPFQELLDKVQQEYPEVDRLVFVCQSGKHRSPRAAEISQSHGVPATFLSEGSAAILNKTQTEIEQTINDQGLKRGLFIFLVDPTVKGLWSLWKPQMLKTLKRLHIPYEVMSENDYLVELKKQDIDPQRYLSVYGYMD